MQEESRDYNVDVEATEGVVKRQKTQTMPEVGESARGVESNLSAEFQLASTRK